MTAESEENDSIYGNTDSGNDDSINSSNNDNNLCAFELLKLWLIVCGGCWMCAYFYFYTGLVVEG